MSKKQETSSENEEFAPESLAGEQPESGAFESASPEAGDGEQIGAANEAEAYKDKYLRLYADFDNFRKRTLKEKSDLIRTAGAEIIKDLLPVLDDFERAMAADLSSQSIESLREGMELIHKKLFHTLKVKGLEPMDSRGSDFDPEIHEAITSIPAPEESLKGKVIDETEKGYRLNGQVIRYAKVVVGQ